LLRELLPFLRWRSRVTPETLKSDLLAGVTGAVVMVPQGVAFATIAGLPPEYGLYAGMVPAVVAALFGSSWHLVSGPTTVASVVLFSTLSTYAIPGSTEYVRLALTLTLMVGVFQLVMGSLRLGALIDFISHTVIVGFVTGAAILIMISQIPNFLGMQIAGGSYIYQTLPWIVNHIMEANLYAVMIGVVSLLSGLAAMRWIPKMPYMLIAMMVGSILGFLLNLIFGSDVTKINMTGAIPTALPALSIPIFSFEIIGRLAPAAAAITLLALTESVTIGRSIAFRSGQNIDNNQEFIGQGLSNIAAGFFSGYVVTGSFNRSAINYEAGAKTPLSAVFSGLLLMAIVVLVAPFAIHLPNASVAAVLFLVAWKLVNVIQIHKIIRASRKEGAVLVITIGTALLAGLEFAILIGVGLGLFMYMLNTTRPRMFSRIPDPSLPNRGFNTIIGGAECPQLKILRIDGPLYFGSTHYVEKMLGVYRQREPQQNHLLLIGVGISEIDISGAELLAQEARRRTEKGGGLYLYRIKEEVAELLHRGGYMDNIGASNQFMKKNVAIASIFSRLDRSICACCDKRIFLECASVPGPEEHTSII